MSITLSPQQDKAVLAFRDWYREHKPAPTDPDDMDWNEFYGSERIWSKPHRSVEESPVFLLEGYAGTGKSTILPFLIESSGLRPSDVLFVAPTGKASKVMTKKLRAQGMGVTASTIHKAIYRPNALKATILEQHLATLEREHLTASQEGDTQKISELARSIKQTEKDLNRAYDSSSPSFQLNVDAAAIKQAKLVVVDECSMVGSEIADDIRSFGVPILAVGDPGQLQPVGDTPGFCNRQADAHLSEIHRQALDNPIIWASLMIREGKLIPYGSHGDGLLRVVDRKGDDATYDLERDAQIIVGTHKKRWQVTRKLRDLCGFAGDGPADGEMMIVTKNSKKYPDLVNGTMVMCRGDVGMLHAGDLTYHITVGDEDDKEYDLTCVQAILEEHYLGKNEATCDKRHVFRAKQNDAYHQIDWAYAITCHKSQGSQWNEVVVHDESGCFRDEADKWLYTAVTRAAERLTLVQ